MGLALLHIGCLVEELSFPISNVLPPDRYRITMLPRGHSTTLPVELNCDCLVVFHNLSIPSGTFLPMVKVVDDSIANADSGKDHAILLNANSLQELPLAINRAISKFLSAAPSLVAPPLAAQELSQKLKERLGYLGIYYKRSPEFFLRAMAEEDRHRYLTKLKRTYHAIVLEYFKETPDRLNQKIDEFVNMAFLADISVSQVLEIHMDLMDKLSKQLRLEGHKDQILLDYRITLIDIIAHLCEMYRRSIPREAI